MAQLSLLGVFAHPDDEQTVSGLLAKSAAEGIKTGLVCATRGELGEIAYPELATPDNLGKVREGEMRAAATVLGVKYLWFLDYRDSGMMGTPGNDDPSCFYRVDDEQALGKLVKIIREFRPTVMVTFDETGGYGHPDHLTIHRLTRLAFDAAADPSRFPDAGEPWQTGRLYYSSFPRGRMQKMAQMLHEAGVDFGFEGFDTSKMGMDDDSITNSVDVSDWAAVKEQSLNMHRTQLDPNSPFRKMPADFLNELRSTEHYALGAGTPLPEGDEARGDVFAGLRG